jgi:hypothetical protein
MRNPAANEVDVVIVVHNLYSLIFSIGITGRTSADGCSALW